MMVRIAAFLLAEQPSAVATASGGTAVDHLGGRGARHARLAAVPGQEPLEVLRHPTAGVRTGVQILGAAKCAG